MKLWASQSDESEVEEPVLSPAQQRDLPRIDNVFLERRDDLSWFSTCRTYLWEVLFFSSGTPAVFYLCLQS